MEHQHDRNSDDKINDNEQDIVLSNNMVLEKSLDDDIGQG